MSDNNAAPVGMSGKDFLRFLNLNETEYAPVGLVSSGLWGVCALLYSRKANAFLLVTTNASDGSVHYSDPHTSVYTIRCGNPDSPNFTMEYRFDWVDALDLAQLRRRDRKEFVSIQHLDTTTSKQDSLTEKNGFPVMYQSYDLFDGQGEVR